MQAADDCDSPVILQGSAGARKYAGEAFLRHLIEAAVETWPHIPVVMHQDHGAQPGRVPALDPLRLHQRDDGRLAAGGHEDAGLLRVQRHDHASAWSRWRMRSASRWRASWACWARWKPARRARRTAPAPRASCRNEQLLTDPEQAADFVRETGVDALAIAIGTSHGAYKFSRKPTGDILAIGRIREIHARIPNTHLVMHGSSSVPQEWLDVIREHGGADQGNLRRAGGGDPGGHPPRRAQGEHRHRHSPGDDRGDAAADDAEARRVRPAQVLRRRQRGGARRSAAAASRRSARRARRRRSGRCRSTACRSCMRRGRSPPWCTDARRRCRSKR